jgi:hypothetical protein
MTRAHASGYRIGAATTTVDGTRGIVCALVVDPHTRTVTHLAVSPPHQHHRARLVPVAMASVQPTGEVRLAYDDETLAHLGELEELDVIDVDDHITAVLVASGHLWSRRTIVVPAGALMLVDSAGVTVADSWDPRRAS